MEVYDNRSLKYHKRYETKDRQLIQFEIDESQSRDNFYRTTTKKKSGICFCFRVLPGDQRERERERDKRFS